MQTIAQSAAREKYPDVFFFILTGHLHVLYVIILRVTKTFSCTYSLYAGLPRTNDCQPSLQYILHTTLYVSKQYVVSKNSPGFSFFFFFPELQDLQLSTIIRIFFRAVIKAQNPHIGKYRILTIWNILLYKFCTCLKKKSIKVEYH